MFNSLTGHALVFLMLLVPGFLGCNKADDKQKATSSAGGKKPEQTTGDDGPPAGHPSDFFPSNSGAKWSYEIQVPGKDPPLMYEQVSWPLNEENAVTYATRGILFSRADIKHDDKPKTYGLELKVKGPAPKQGPLQYPKGVEVEVLKDELSVFRDHKQLFWAIAESGRFTVNLVATYSPDKPRAPGGGAFGGWGRKDGSAMRLFFFADEPGIQIGLEGSPDTLLFSGVEKNLRGYEGVECFHFVRSVKAAEEKEDKEPGARAGRLNKGFTEDMWFARGKGLVRLEQKVDGIPSMTWSLKSFSADGK